MLILRSESLPIRCWYCCCSCAVEPTWQCEQEQRGIAGGTPELHRRRCRISWSELIVRFACCASSSLAAFALDMMRIEPVASAVVRCLRAVEKKKEGRDRPRVQTSAKGQVAKERFTRNEEEHNAEVAPVLFPCVWQHRSHVWSEAEQLGTGSSAAPCLRLSGRCASGGLAPPRAPQCC